MEMQLDRDAGLMLQKSMEQLGSRCTSASRRPASSATAPSPACSSRTARASTATCWSIAAGIRPNVALAKSAGLDDQARHRRRRRHGDVRPVDLRRRRVRRAPRHGLRLVAPLWEQTAVLADRLTGRAEDKVYEARAPRRSSR
jgi:NAD(P)H-nitrite reductase large subunit